MHKIVKGLCAAVFMLAAGFVTATPASAVVELDITQGNVQPLPIAIADFQSQDGLGKKISDVVSADLKRSGLFAPIDPSAFIQKGLGPDVSPNFQDWTVINAQALVVGRVSPEADGRLRVEFRLWDVFAGSVTLSPMRSTSASPARRAISTAASSSSPKAATRRTG